MITTGWRCRDSWCTREQSGAETARTVKKNTANITTTRQFLHWKIARYIRAWKLSAQPAHLLLQQKKLVRKERQQCWGTGQNCGPMHPIVLGLAQDASRTGAMYAVNSSALLLLTPTSFLVLHAEYSQRNRTQKVWGFPCQNIYIL